MWEYVHLPQEANDPGEKERLIERFAMEKIQEYDGTVFLCIARSDRERRLTFRQAAQSLGLSARDGRAECAAQSAEALAKSPGRNVLFVEPSMQQYLGEYLDACPTGARHLLLYSRRHGNGPSPHMSAFMDFWLERSVDIWDFCDIDKNRNVGGIMLDQSAITIKSALLNMTSTAHWQDRWWLLDVETSGLHPPEAEIIALYLARMEDLAVVEERVILVRPLKPLEPRIERLTGISNQDLEHGIALEDAMRQLKELEGENFLIHDYGFDLPFLERASARCHLAYKPQCVLLDRLAVLLLRGPDHRRISLKTRNLLERLPDPPASWPDVPPNTPALKDLYRLALALFGKLAVEYNVHNTSQLVHLFESEE